MQNPFYGVIQRITSQGVEDENRALGEAARLRRDAEERAAVVTRLGELETQLLNAERLMRELPEVMKASATQARDTAFSNLAATAANGAPEPSFADAFIRHDWILAHQDEIIAAARKLTVERIRSEMAELKKGRGFLAALGIPQ